MDLPPPEPMRDCSLYDALRRRRSVREHSEEPLTARHLANLVWAAQGVSRSKLRTVPSAGGLFPLAMSVVAARVRDVDAGLYSYVPHAHRLDLGVRGDLRPTVAEAGIGEQSWLSTCAALILISGDVDGALAHFADQPPGTRGRRYVALEAGAAAQNIALQAAADGIGCVLVGGFDDDAVRGYCPSGHEPLAVLAIGDPRDTSHPVE